MKKSPPTARLVVSASALSSETPEGVPTSLGALPAIIPADDAEAVSRSVLSLAAIGHDPSLIPETWEEQAALIDVGVTMGRRLILMIAEIVSKGHEQCKDPSAYLAACVERWGWQKCYIHHLRCVGDLLRRAIGRRECNPVTLLSLDFDKLLCLSRLPAHLFATFMERNNPGAMSRDSVRDVVNNYLRHQGIPPEDDRPDPVHTRRPQAQADFLDVLFAPDNGGLPPAEYQTRVHARADTVPQDERSKVLFRSLVVVDAMVDRMTGPLLLVVAEQLRKLADSADRLARQPAGKALGPHV